MRKAWNANKFLAIIGEALLIFPVIFMFLTAIVGSISMKSPIMDFLMTAELFPMILLGSGLIIFVACKIRIYKIPLIWGLIVIVLSLISSQAVAVISGIASGKTEAAGFPFFIIIFLLITYNLAVIIECILGVCLLKKIKKA